MMTAVVHCLRVFPLIIPLRHRVSHAAASRGVADPVVVAVELTNGTMGYGETVPRPYVTGESVDFVIDTIQTTFIPAVIRFHADSFPAALEALEALPWRRSDGRLVPAARAAVELALLDAVMKTFGRTIEDMVQWMGLPGFGSPGSIERIRFSGVLAADDLPRTRRQLRLMYWGGLRNFKLKVGQAGDQDHLRWVLAYLHRPLVKQRVSLRLDANGAWTQEQALRWLAGATAGTTKDCISAWEQPLPRGSEQELAPLKHRFGLALMHDESLITMEDAHRLIDLEVADYFNIRISKCGGLLPSLRLAALARRRGVGVQLGCMVGETSILSAAGLRFLQVCPAVRWAEGCWGSFLLDDDVASPPLRFGFRGRPPRLDGPGLGAVVQPQALDRLCEGDPVVTPL